MTGSDDLRADLEREIYWLTRGEESEPPTTTQQIRVAADRLAQRLHRDAQHIAPWSDPSLSRSRGFRRRVKAVLHRIVRPISRRYDRIGAELAFVSAQLADSLLQTEAELRRLREDLEAIEERLSAQAPASPHGEA
jgi:hypothetical protein